MDTATPRAGAGRGVGVLGPLSPMGAITGVSPPPLALPASHFAAALLFLVLGGAGLVVAAPDLAAGSYLSSRVTGVTHLFTLGWITTSIMGALYQLMPVALEREIRWLRLAWVSLVLHAPGLLVFVAGLVFQRPWLTVAGAATVATALLAFSLNLGVTLKRAPRRDTTWKALAFACTFLVITVVVGAALAANLRWPFMGSDRILALATHLHVALVGWVLLVMVGVGQRLLPMFLLSHGAGERLGAWAVRLLASGAGLLFALHHSPWPGARRVPAALMVAGVVCFLLQARAFYRTRQRPDVDVGMRMVAGALGVLAGAPALGATLAVVGFARPHLATAYVLLLVLGITLFVAAHYYKIVPFLVWLHRFGPLAGSRPVPRVGDLYGHGWAGAAGGLLTLGVVTLALSVAMGWPVPARGGAILFLVGATVEAAQMAALTRVRPS